MCKVVLIEKTYLVIFLYTNIPGLERKVFFLIKPKLIKKFQIILNTLHI